MAQFVSPLSIYFVWYPSDSERVSPVFDYCFSLLSRDINKPFSRSMNLPIYYRTSTHKGVPIDIEGKSQRNLVFVFISRDLVIDDSWSEYINRMSQVDKLTTIPIALDKSSFKHIAFNNQNFIRAFEFHQNYYNEQSFIAITHEIYRYALNDDFQSKGIGKDNALKLFLSHTKDGENGIILANALKAFIDNSSMRNFFDATDIAPGYRFDEEIVNSIRQSTLIAIHTDSYSSRYWCQREIISAKDNDRPILAVDSIEEFEDRRFPYATNIPGIHINLTGEPTHRDLLRILSATLLETVRYFYAKLLLKEYKTVELIDNTAEILSRPPEVSDIEKLLSVNEEKEIISKSKQLVYPEPPVYSEEINFLSKLGIECKTPLTLNFCLFSNKNFGISISDLTIEDGVKIGQTPAHLIQLSQDLARHLISRGAELTYGGDLRDNGFTEFIFNESLAYQTRAMTDKIQIHNYIAWPIYTADTEKLKDWKANYITIAKMIEVPPADDILDFIPNVKAFMLPSNAENLYVWSRNLTEMRKILAEKCNIRICAGGRLTGYKGIIPGILEEIILTAEKKRPLFLLGGFGGITASICEAIRNKFIPKELTKEWQIENNAGYKELLDLYEQRSPGAINYEKISESILNIEFNNGLTEEENLKLFSTPFNDEALYFVFKGIRNLSSQ
ncbi:TIR domain-containing protein [Paenibacillus odorifer]|uniref:TIR domain-containing protein n=1 Tax=Paenibacillus odorifer TaxID=189426 RepID=UPI001140F502|nr:TIR domain-containing protein [Paenibacillus odorifer]